MDWTQSRLIDLGIPLTAVLALAVVVAIYRWLREQDAGTERMQEIAGFIQMGPWTLAFYLIGVKVIGATLAIFMLNVGGAWDNVKKYVEEGHFGGKGSEAHKAGVIGDTFGDSLKDTTGPSLHIPIKLQNILGITLLPLFYAYAIHWN